MNLSGDDVRDILRLLDSLPFDEFELETSDFSLRLRRGPGGAWAQDLRVLREPVPAEPLAEPSSEPPSPPPEGAPEPGLREIRTPLLGTFYRAPGPGAPPFVEVGDAVTAGTVVAIIETMKLMNPVYAGTGGVVVEICLADGQFAAQDAVLLRVRPQPG